MSLEQKLSSIRLALQNYGAQDISIVGSLTPARVSDIPIAATDGRTIFLGEKFLEASVPDQAIIYSHEVVHVMLAHPWRCMLLRKQRPHQFRGLANIAADCVTNYILQNTPATSKQAMKTIAQWGAVDWNRIRQASLRMGGDPAVFNEPDAEKLGLEQIYYALEKLARDNETDGSGLCERLGAEDHEDIQETGSHEISEDEIIREIVAREALNRSLNISRNKELNPPDAAKVGMDWRKTLRRMIATAIAPRPSFKYNRLSKKQMIAMALGIDTPFQPAFRVTNMVPKIAVIVDTSGSIYSDEVLLGAFIREVRIAASHADVITIYADAEIKKEEQVLPTTKIVPVGGGCTSFVAALKRVEELDVTAAFYLTDLMGEFPKACKKPVFWIVPEERDAPVPFGTKILVR